ncbi:hypothetical protein MHY1_00637 [Methylovirgula sp. HY1]|nr:hypothetical protein MHY1_00637 [Methylovirgula sp. HY1]
MIRRNHERPALTSRGRSARTKCKVSGCLLLRHSQCRPCHPCPEIQQIRTGIQKGFPDREGRVPCFLCRERKSGVGQSGLQPRRLPGSNRSSQSEGPRGSGVVFRYVHRAILDILAALDGLCCEEGERDFKGFPASEFKQRFAQLIGLSAEQVSVVEATLNGNTQTPSERHIDLRQGACASSSTVCPIGLYDRLRCASGGWKSRTAWR